VNEYYIYKNKKQVLELFVHYPDKAYNIIEQSSEDIKIDKDVALAAVVLDGSIICRLS